MSDLSDTIKGFYSEFILRDLLSFVTPGAIVVGAFIFLLSGFFSVTIPQQHNDLMPVIISGELIWTVFQMPIFAWILLFGFFYVVGFSIQCLGEKTRLLQFPPENYENHYRKQYSINFGLNEKFRNSKYYETTRLPFLRHTRNTDNKNFDLERKTEERFVVLLQASGNSALALFIACILILFGMFVTSDSNQNKILSAIIIGLICVLLSILQKNLYLKFPLYEIIILLFLVFIICLILPNPILVVFFFLTVGIALYHGYELHVQRLLDWESAFSENPNN